jgi:ABC-type lipoprotein release transport system permease subunit
MIRLFRMAFRDLGRNPVRSFLSALALAIGMFLLMFMASVLRGEINSAMDKAITLQSGDLQVRAKTYDENKASLSWEDLVENPDAVAAQIASLQPVKLASPRLFASGVVTQGNNTAGVQVIGIDPASSANAPFQDGMVSGSYLTADDREGLLIGQALANKLDIKAGEQVNLLVNTANGDVAQQPFTVRGVYSTRTPNYDETTVFLPIAKAQAITGTQNHASTIFVLLKNRDQTNAVAAALQTGQYEVVTWEKANQLLVTFEQFANPLMYMLYLIVLGIVVIVIINTFIMAVFERTREIGILAAIGMKGRRIMAMFLAESTLLAIGGILMGLVLGSLGAYLAVNVGIKIPSGNLGMTTSGGLLLGERLYGAYSPSDYIGLMITAFIVTLLAALYPAWLAAHMEPVEALRGSQ